MQYNLDKYLNLAPYLNGLVSTSLQKVYIKVDEKRTEPTAVTVISLVRECYFDKQKPYKFIVDRPFVFVIYDHENDLILFVGKVTNPNEK